MALKRTDVRNIFKDVEGVTDDHIKQVMDLCHGEIDPLRDEIDKLNDDLTEAKKDNGWQKKYEDEHKAFEKFKKDQTAKETYAGKESAYKALLVDAKVSENVIDLILSAQKDFISSLELKEDGTIKTADKVTESIKTDYAKHITEEKQSGANTQNPPGNNTTNDFEKLSLDEKMALANKEPNNPQVREWLNS